MKCKKIQKYLSAYVDGEADKKVQIRVEAHLKDCQDCQVKVESLRQTWEWLGDEVKIEPSPFLAAKIKRRINEFETSTAKQPRWFPSFAKLLVPVTAAAGMALGVFLGSQLSSEIAMIKTATDTASEIIETTAGVLSDFPEGSLTSAYKDLDFLNNDS